MEINEYKLKLSGTANLPKPLDLDKEYDLTISCAEVRNSTDNPTQDGMINRVFKLAISEMSEVNIISSKEIIRASKKKFSQSQALRRIIEGRWEEDEQGDKEDYYKHEMSIIIDEYKTKHNF